MLWRRIAANGVPLNIRYYCRSHGRVVVMFWTDLLGKVGNEDEGSPGCELVPLRRIVLVQVHGSDETESELRKWHALSNFFHGFLCSLGLFFAN